MYSLRDLQGNFVRGIVSGADYADSIAGPGPRARFAIYRNNVFSNYREALRAIYPVMDRLVGRQFFDRVADHYIDLFPSTSGDLNEYGQDFPEIIAGFPGAAPLVYLRDVARLEWMIHESFHAADYPEIALDFVTNMSPERFEALSFALHPACRLIASPYPILRIWRANQEGAPKETIDLNEGGCNVLIARPQYEVELRPLATGEFVMLKAFAAGKSFGEAFSRTIEADLKFDVVRFMQTHVAARTLVDFRPLVASR
ncbi:MAG: HvfC/BufC family peptide modification chaperone [Burkholderiales bacterium]